MSDTLLQVASSFLNMTAQSASLIPAAKSTLKGADDIFSTNSKTCQVENAPCTIQVSDQKLREYRDKTQR